MSAAVTMADVVAMTESTPPALWPRPCSCGARYHASEWAALPFVGVQVDADGNPQLVLKNCSRCASTISMPWVRR